jgi:hypothetical protein
MSEGAPRNGTLANIGTAAVDALKGSPGLLVLALFCTGVLAMVYFSVRESNARRDKHLLFILEHCSPPSKGADNGLQFQQEVAREPGELSP